MRSNGKANTMGESYYVIFRADRRKVAGPFKTKARARCKRDRLDNAHGSYAYAVSDASGFTCL